MSFVSYAQNLEDVMLHRALKHVELGFYIDVGAWHPTIDSLTKAFYDRGWRGINIEPSREYAALLQQQRPEDINLNIAVGAHDGTAVFHEVSQTGLSTLRKDYADLHAKADKKVTSYTIDCKTLNAVCAEHGVDVVHFLSIDAEGSEKAVLSGFAFDKVRPWVVVIEANHPNSTWDVSSEWESMILGKSYQLVYCDGLNRFYIAEERSELGVHFTVPPNFFDRYISYSHRTTQQELIRERAQRELLREQLRSAQHALAGERAQRESLAVQLQGVYTSYSWRITAPMRRGYSILRPIVTPPVRVVRWMLALILRTLLRSRLLRRTGARLLSRSPALRDRVGRLIVQETPGGLADLPESARAVLQELRTAVRDVATRRQP